MRVLWFSVTPSLFNPYSNTHNGGGWIASLEQAIRKQDNIDLGVAFYFQNDCAKYQKDGVSYYTLPVDSRGLIAKWIHPEKESLRVERYLKVIEDFKPDIIQIFGCENDFGLICDKTHVPVVIHIQGMMAPCYNALFPIGMNRYDFIWSRDLTLRRRLVGWRSGVSFARRAEREQKIIKSCKNFIGRTSWDKNLISLFNPCANYYHCDEILRDSFQVSEKKWFGLCLPERNKIRLISVISNPWYKGIDLILKTAKLLKENSSIDFEWNIFGVRDIRFYERKYKIKASDVSVSVKGAVDKLRLVEELCSSSIYVHSSYIDNSPNSLCEAQYLGVPVISTNVGGIPSLVTDGKTGVLVPANDPFQMASRIIEMVSDSERLIEMSNQEQKVAHERHNQAKIIDRLVHIYSTILQK